MLVKAGSALEPMSLLLTEETTARIALLVVSTVIRYWYFTDVCRRRNYFDTIPRNEKSNRSCTILMLDMNDTSIFCVPHKSQMYFKARRWRAKRVRYGISEVRYSDILMIRRMGVFDILSETTNSVVVRRCPRPRPSVLDRFDASRLATGSWPAMQSKAVYVNRCRLVPMQRVGCMTHQMYL